MKPSRDMSTSRVRFRTPALLLANRNLDAARLIQMRAELLEPLAEIAAISDGLTQMIVEAIEALRPSRFHPFEILRRYCSCFDHARLQSQ